MDCELLQSRPAKGILVIKTRRTRSIAATHQGIGTESPSGIMAGKNRKLDIAGRYIRLPYLGTDGHKTLGNWYTTLLNAHGNPIAHYGDLDLEMARKKLPQTGAISQFMV